jgi:3-isopropylmalate dehydrogenase/methanogen homoisocitrate dehydrogenase
MYDLAVISGDGIGPEVMEVTLDLLDVLDVSFNFIEAYAGCECYNRTGTTIPDETIQIARKADAALFGAVTTVPGQKSGILTLRKALDLYANVRPVKSYPGVPALYPDLDLVIIRENTEGLYSGIEEETPEGATAQRIVTEGATERICKFAFEYVRRTGRNKVTAVHKANVLKKTDGIFKDTFYNVARNYSDIEPDDRYVDATAMFLITKPHMFDVIVTTNLFGDILSDEGAGLVGGLGLAPSANIGEKKGLFEPVHGSGPDISGQGISNPSAMILSAVMMLNYLQEYGEAQRLEKALSTVLREGKSLTPDLGGTSKTENMAREIKGKLELN